MGMFEAASGAALANGFGYQIFREIKEPREGPLMATYFFIFSLFLDLWSIRLYPQNIRKLGRFQIFIEFLMAQFLMELLIVDFWFPLEAAVSKFLPRIAYGIEDTLAEGEWICCETLCDILRSDVTKYLASYALSGFFLLATLHATRAIDLRILMTEGPSCFLKDITHRVKINKRRFLRRLGFGGKKRVNINESNNIYSYFCGSPLSGDSGSSKAERNTRSHVANVENERKQNHGGKNDDYSDESYDDSDYSEDEDFVCPK